MNERRADIEASRNRWRWLARISTTAFLVAVTLLAVEFFK